MFESHIAALIQKYRRKGVLLDTNLLLLLVLGNYAPARILSFKRTRSYSPLDFQRLHELISKFEVRWTTPNILTEVDNLGRQLPQAEHLALATSVRQVAGISIEIVRPSRYVTALSYYSKFGLTDAVSILLSRECLVVSDDFRLCNYIASTGLDAINFNELRARLA